MAEYKDTLNLPKTDFEMRAGLAEKEPRLLARWESEGLYARLQKAREKGPRFVFHDGPPYANGHLHNGHILNKVLKDIVVKDHSMRGARTSFIPGWDCHGLPIEVQVDKELGKKKAGMSKVEIRQACRAYAEKFVAIQRDEFKRLGVMARWERPYTTMSFSYEAATVRELARVCERGLLVKGLRPVQWCAVHQTALAEAEVEYEDHASPSVYVAFSLTKLPAGLSGAADIVIWTTTPWTLPANLAVCVHPDFDYVAIKVRDRTVIVAEKLVEPFLAAVGAPSGAKPIARFKGRELEGLTYRQPLNEKSCPVILGEHVTLEAGTGCVHTAPGHGEEDFLVGRRYGLPVLSPVDDRGVFTAEAGQFAGKPAMQANGDIIQELVSRGTLLNKPTDTLTHRYAHCWRCHKPLLLRATEQWFVSLDTPFGGGKSLRERALAALKEVTWVPSWGYDRIHGMLAARPDWCLSRQRVWGVPIPVAYCEKCATPLVDAARMRQVAEVFEREGADAWFARPLDELMGKLVCTKCKGTAFRKESDIVDVWFDSGVSFAAVIEAEQEGQAQGPPVDIYLEGSDQHRGWFHSSLLCSIATRERPPYRTVLTHGFVVDGEGKKVSKSKGNFIDPFETIKTQGGELLRLWVAAEDYREDIRLSPEILTRLTDSYRKVRNTIRYLLGNLYDFDANRDLVSARALLPLDAYALNLLADCRAAVDAAYTAYEFHGVLHKLVELCTVDLSAFYFDVLKDRLYASRPASPARRSAQSALYLIARDLLRLMAPIFCFTAEESWSFLTPRLVGDADSVHLCLYPGYEEPAAVRELWQGLAARREELMARYSRLREVRRLVTVDIETARKSKVLGASVEAAVTLTGTAADIAWLKQVGVGELADVFIVSQVTLAVGGELLRVSVGRAPGTKCQRCWLYREEVGRDAKHPELCRRCCEALG